MPLMRKMQILFYIFMNFEKLGVQRHLVTDIANCWKNFQQWSVRSLWQVFNT